MPIKVLIIDDSALVRSVLSEILSGDPGIQVVGTASDPYIAREKIKQLNPDVLTLDVEMPRMDGLTFLDNLMRLRPMPVLMVSSLTERGAEITFQALELGAVDFVTKPAIDVKNGLEGYAQVLRDKVHAVACARPQARTVKSGTASPEVISARPRSLRTTEKIIAIGASTGGTEAIKAVLETMPPDAPAIVITQHIPAMFSAPFAARMDRSSAMSVCEAQDGQQILPGHVYIAPGSHHLLVERSGARYYCRLSDAPPENRHRPSVDTLFRSVAEYVGANAVAAILTGMGDDGARQLLALREIGARTLVQDEATSVVWGMPGAAAKIGAAECVLPLDRITAQLLEWTQ
ncbi:chemotaxis response regulator protein-glutamate methylesterase [Sinimarinibacterium sp. NLF-5-8]|uniref:protein-glutamate methylesterase/protein-glutamine glutaminase n=1 Tax=Sinimarinibacterium sp. NLF-5-8 TaxID=2698684 RepID=UPI00137BF83D|nr:chemotaxis response regulator protein-glutamate methylesterase [Sinimarinibacterium sp. NLF-5-8]QHS08725.1 chemotaxis response regulator protein-glutamate methylesterase [Sinimarinibacterium sp. NLF-5-8]